MSAGTCSTTGYTGDGFVCGDADECALGIHLCHENAKCINREATYECACKRGFRPVADDCERCFGGFRCDDIDECAEGTDHCNAERATCINEPGTFRCRCDDFYQGDGIICLHRPPSAPPEPPALPPLSPPPPSPLLPPSPPGTWTQLAKHRWPCKLVGDWRDDVWDCENTTVIQAGKPAVFKGTNGWWGWPCAACVSECGPLGYMLGGYKVFGPGAYVERTFEQLPPHSELRIQLVYYRVDAWGDGQGQLFVDGNLVVSKSFSYMEQGSTRACGTMGHPINSVHSGAHTRTCAETHAARDSPARAPLRADEIPYQVDAVVQHYSDTVTIRVTSSVTRSGWWWGEPHWGMNDFVLSTAVPHPSPPPPPSPPGVWSEWLYEDNFPGATNWTGSAVSGVDLSEPAAITSCGQLGMMMGGYGIFGAGSYAEKTFHDLPAHAAVRVQLRFFKIDAWRAGPALVMIDGSEVWRKQSFSYREAGSTSACGTRGHPMNNEGVADVDVTASHYSSSVTIRVTSNMPSQYTKQFWGFNHVKLMVVTPFPTPPEPPSPPGHWTEDLFHERWPGATGWSGVPDPNLPSTQTVCGGLGSMLGGYGQFGPGAYAEKTFTGLPPHSGIRIKFSFFAIDSWPARGSAGQVLVDGAVMWQTLDAKGSPPSEHACGSFFHGAHSSLPDCDPRVSRVNLVPIALLTASRASQWQAGMRSAPTMRTCRRRTARAAPRSA